jgi:hypothetical protein
MNVLFLLLGALLLVFAIVDLLWTTLWVDGGSGPISGRLSTGLWAGLRRVAGQRSRALGLDEVFSARMSELDGRRRKLLGMIHADAWEWPASGGAVP